MIAENETAIRENEMAILENETVPGHKELVLWRSETETANSASVAAVCEKGISDIRTAARHAEKEEGHCNLLTA